MNYVIATFSGSPGNVTFFHSVVARLDDQSTLTDLCNDTIRMTVRFCDACRGFVFPGLTCLEADLIPYVYGLKHLERHL